MTNSTIKTPKSKKTMFLRNEFIEWLQDNDIYTKESSKSAASRVKSLNDKFICKLIPGKHYDFLKQLPNHINEDAEKTILLLDKLITHVYDSEVKPEDYSINASTFKYMKRAFSLYVSFIKELIYDNYFTSDKKTKDEITETEDEIELYENIVNKVCFNNDYIKDNFKLRLITQDRLSNSKTIFYPIRLIRKIFTTHDKLVKLGLINGSPNEKKNLFDIIHNSINKINVITDKGIFKLQDVKMLEIDLGQKNVTVILHNKERATLLTKTDKGETEKMKVSDFKDISIDHVVSMADILEEKASRLPTLNKLTEMIKLTAKKNNISITSKNLSILNNKVIENIKLSDITPLLIKLKDELTIIDEVSELQLMERTYNIRKK